MLQRSNEHFPSDRLQNHEICMRILDEPGNWLLFSEHGNPTAIRRLDENRLFYIGIQSVKLFGKCSVKIAVITEDRQGSVNPQLIDITTDSHGRAILCRIDTEINNIGSVTRVYQRSPFGGDWQFCMFQTEGKRISVGGSYTLLKHHCRSAVFNHRPTGERQYPPLRPMNFHVASLCEMTNRQSAKSNVGVAPIWQNQAPILPEQIAQKFLRLVKNSGNAGEAMTVHLDDIVCQSLLFFEKNSDLEL